MYGVSDNARSWYDNSRAYELGYAPQCRSEDYADKILATEPKEGKHLVAEHYQGGPFCSAEYSADFEKISKSE